MFFQVYGYFQNHEAKRKILLAHVNLAIVAIPIKIPSWKLTVSSENRADNWLPKRETPTPWALKLTI